ncbi:hypothetical protein NE237_016368 [Protea cynaroides]|uniref:CS domain-containing protein n=1 Tax=Protea cynaroides TaxID=273540 RepID=A0A9Q0GL99_9MAGN|nr:hypothetical protein NE237_016368 [Protea cynaroides]
MAIISDIEEEPEHQRPSTSSSSESSAGRYDGILKPILDQQGPLGLMETMIDFIRRKTDLFKDESLEKKIPAIVSSKRKYAEERKKKAAGERVGRNRKGREAAERRELKGEIKAKENGAVRGTFMLRPRTCCFFFFLQTSGNGLDLENYSWTQTLQEVTVTVPVPPRTKSRFIACEIKKDRLKVGLKGQPPIIDGDLYQSVKVDDCFWSIEDAKFISVLLTKQNQREWWKCLVKGDPEIDTQKFDQRQKSMGLPKFLFKIVFNLIAFAFLFMQHPEMDSSRAKIS